MAKSLAEILGKLQVSIDESEGRITSGKVESISPLKIRKDKLLITQDYIIKSSLVDYLSLKVGQEVILLQSNRQQTYYILDIFDNPLTTKINKDIDAKIVPVTNRIGGVDLRIDGIDTRINGVDTRINGVDTSIGTVDGRVDGLVTRIGTAELDIGTVDGRVDGLVTSIGNVDSRVTGVASRVTTLEGAPTYPIVDYRANNLGMAIGKTSEKDAFEVAIPTEFTDTVDFTISAKVKGRDVSTVENGSTSNGRFIKFDDGTMVCYRTVSPDRNSSERQDFDFPHAFSNRPSVSASHYYGTSGFYQKANSTMFLAADESKWIVTFLDTASVGATLGMDLMAIGRW